MLKKEREEILALKTRNELILDAIGEGLYVTDRQGNITQVNPAAAAMTGWRAEELLGKPSHATLHHTRPDGSHYPREECPMYATYRDGHVHQSDDDHFWRKNGTLFPIRLVSTPIKEEGRVAGAVVVFSDISARKDAEWAVRETLNELRETNRKLEEAHHQLLQSEKLASIGQLAAGVAHEINNPIGYVYSNLGTLGKYLADLFRLIDEYGDALKQLDGTPEAERLMALEKQLDLDFLREDLNALMDESREGITRVKKIIQDLKDFSRAGANEEFQWADLHQGLESTLNIVHNELKYKARVIRHYGELPQIECLPSQLNQVFMNLLVNAAHAIPEKGDITVSTGSEGGEVWVKVADTGKGIPPENLKRIFDPFFTTKPVGKGTGLGLSLAHGIVEKHQGRIEVESEVGKGACFTVRLPVRQSPEETHD
jgi:PAS domain S-box-containing protein